MKIHRKPAPLRQPNRRVRGGTTLMETLVVIGLVTFLLSSVAVSLHSMYGLDTRVRENFDLLASRSKLSIRLRDDAHMAKTAQLVDAQLTLELDNGNQVVYSTMDSQIERLVKREGNVVHRDSFLIAEEAEVIWTAKSVDDNPFVMLQTRKAASNESEIRPESDWRVECAVGMIARYHKRPTAEDDK